MAQEARIAELAADPEQRLEVRLRAIEMRITAVTHLILASLLFLAAHGAAVIQHRWESILLFLLSCLYAVSVVGLMWRGSRYEKDVRTAQRSGVADA
jgi:hypothetical protein